MYPHKNQYCSAWDTGTKPEKEENKNHVQCPNYSKDWRIIGNSGARDVRTSVVDGIPESSNRFFVRLKHLDVVHVALPIFHVSRMVPRYHPALIVRPYHCPYRAVVCLNREITFLPSKKIRNTQKHFTLTESHRNITTWSSKQFVLYKIFIVCRIQDCAKFWLLIYVIICDNIVYI